MIEGIRIRVIYIIGLVLLTTASSFAGVYTVTNSNNSGGGSLAQAMTNVNAAGAGPHTIQFAIPTTDPNYDISRGVITITLTSLLPVLTKDNVTIDATTQTTAIGNNNPGQLGSGGTVGTDSLTFSQVVAPEIEIVDGGGLIKCFDIQANNDTIRGFAIYGFGTDINSLWHGAIVSGDWTVVYTGGLIEGNILGSPADTIVDPAPGNPNTSYGISLVRANTVTIQNNIVAFRLGAGISIYQFANNIQVINNEVRNCGVGSPNFDGIGTGSETYNNTISRNRISDNGAVGLECWRSQGNNTFENNTITGSGYSLIAGQEEAGIRLSGTGNSVRKNIIQNNNGPGIMVFGQTGGVAYTPSHQNLISQNYFIGNEKNAIDLVVTGTDLNQGDGITLNDAAPTACGILATSGNDGLDFPVIDSAKYFSGMDATTIYGRACPNSIIEFYIVQSASGDTLAAKVYGEGTWYVDSTTTDGSGFFVKTVSGLDSSNYISSIVIDASNNTSEFSENEKVQFVPENCGNGVDDDGDGLVDCLDTLDCRPATPGTITPSNSIICAGTSGETYSIAAVAGATSYSWTVPAGALITAGQGTVSITVGWGTTPGNVCVTASNAFCTSLQQCVAIPLKFIPNGPAVISH